MTDIRNTRPLPEATLRGMLRGYGELIDTVFTRQCQAEDALVAAVQVHESAFGLYPGPEMDAELERTGAELQRRTDELEALTWLLTDLVDRQAVYHDALERVLDARRRHEFAEDCRRALAGPFYEPGDAAELEYADAACD